MQIHVPTIPGMNKYLLTFGEPYVQMMPGSGGAIGYTEMTYTILAPSDGVAKEKMDRFLHDKWEMANGEKNFRKMKRLVRVIAESV